MIPQQTTDQLYLLKLTVMAEAYKEQQVNPLFDTLSFDERFGILVDAELAARNNKHIEYLIKKAGMKINAAVEEIEYGKGRNLDKSMILKLTTCSWIKNSLNVIITGKTGVGKSFLSCALGNCACRKNYKVLYRRLPRLIMDIAISKGDGSYNKKMNELKKADVLILDDWGLSALTQSESRDILEIIEERNNSGATIVNSQIPTKEWHGLFTNPTVADAIMDRLVHGAYVIDISGENMRKVKKTQELENENNG
jgi:DNA replication protein DnaC